jgi:hypothetical protein
MEALMGIISEQEFNKRSKTDTAVIYGCGYSLNRIGDLELHALSEFDSVAFNWFCFSKIPTTYYLVREQANLSKRTHGEETINNFYSIMNKYYNNSCLVIHDLTKHSPNAYNYSFCENSEKFLSDYIVVQDTKLKGNDPGVELWKDKSIFDSGIYHGKTTMTNALHFAVWMGYRRIIFVGVDLYDSRYFWLKDNETRYSVKDKNKNMNSQHQTAKNTITLIKKVKKIYPKLKMYTYNKKSLLSKHMGVWDGKT